MRQKLSHSGTGLVLGLSSGSFSPDEQERLLPSQALSTLRDTSKTVDALRLECVFSRVLVCIMPLLASTAAASDCAAFAHAESASAAHALNLSATLSDLAVELKAQPGSTLIFGADIGKDGRVRNVCCLVFGEGVGHVNYVEFEKIVQRVRFEPAKAGKRELRTWLNMAIRFDPEGPRLLPYATHPRDVNPAEYVAPQRIGSFRGTYLPFSDRILIEVDVDETGAPTAARVKDPERLSVRGRSAARRMAAKMMQKCFVPGRVAGQPAATRYLEVFDGFNRPTSTWNSG